jgi:hypothetical protein
MRGRVTRLITYVQTMMAAASFPSHPYLYATTPAIAPRWHRRKDYGCTPLLPVEPSAYNRCILLAGTGTYPALPVEADRIPIPVHHKPENSGAETGFKR